MISKILSLQPRISKVFLDHLNTFSHSRAEQFRWQNTIPGKKWRQVSKYTSVLRQYLLTYRWLSIRLQHHYWRNTLGWNPIWRNNLMFKYTSSTFSWYIYENIMIVRKIEYRKVASSNTSHLGAHAGFFKLLMERIFDPCVLWPFDKKCISELVTRVRSRN